jgi:hypothetical protein
MAHFLQNGTAAKQDFEEKHFRKNKSAFSVFVLTGVRSLFSPQNTKMSQNLCLMAQI